MSLASSLLQPIHAFRLHYVPLVMVYFAYGALGLVDVTRDMWVKEELTWTPAELAGIGVWLTLPWTVKMVFGELVDCVPLFGSQRRSYILLGAAFVVGGLREIGEPARKALIVDLAEPHVRARSVGLYYLVRSVAISPAALAGGALWALSPRLPFLAATIAGAIGTIVFASTVRDEHAA